MTSIDPRTLEAILNDKDGFISKIKEAKANG